MEIDANEKTWHTKVDSSGRVLMPHELRKSLDLHPGSNLIWKYTEDGVRLETFGEVLAAIQAYCKGLAPASEVWSEELLNERREEAARE